MLRYATEDFLIATALSCNAFSGAAGRGGRRRGRTSRATPLPPRPRRPQILFHGAPIDADKMAYVADAVALCDEFWRRERDMLDAGEAYLSCDEALVSWSRSVPHGPIIRARSSRRNSLIAAGRSHRAPSPASSRYRPSVGARAARASVRSACAIVFIAEAVGMTARLSEPYEAKGQRPRPRSAQSRHGLAPRPCKAELSPGLTATSEVDGLNDAPPAHRRGRCGAGSPWCRVERERR